jgi:hypothetical protein
MRRNCVIGEHPFSYISPNFLFVYAVKGKSGIMGKVSTPSSLKLGKMASFSPNFKVQTNGLPANLNSPYYVAKHNVRYVV